MAKHIALAGNIGAGKSTLAAKLASKYNWRLELESVDDNPYLADFYEDMQTWSFHLQVHFLNSRFQQVKRIQNIDQHSVQDRSIYEDANIFAKNLHQSQFMADREYQNYLDLYESMVSIVQIPDLLIYLKADLPTLIRRIEMRNRSYESAIRLDYLKNLNHLYEDWIANYDLGKLLIIDVNKLDFVKNQEDLAFIFDQVDRELFGIFT